MTTRQRRPLLQHIKQQLTLLAHLLEALIASFVARKWHCKRGHFSDGNQAPDCRWIICCLRKWRGGNVAILSHRLALTTPCCKRPFGARCDAFPAHGNTHLPQRARDPLWRPPSGHFFSSLRSIYPSRSGYIRVDVPFGFLA